MTDKKREWCFFTVTVDKDFAEKIDRLAKELGIPRGKLVEGLVKYGCEKLLEEVEKKREAEKHE